MTKAVLPLNIKKYLGPINTPISIFQSRKIAISFEVFSLEEKRKLYNLPDLKVDNGISFSGKTPPTDIFLIAEYISTNYKITISNYSEEILDALNFAFTVVLGRHFPVIFEDERFGIHYKKFISFREINNLNSEDLKRIGIIFRAILEHRHKYKKLGTLEALLETAFTKYKRCRANGAFFISILESIAINEKLNQGIGMRMAKKLSSMKVGDRHYRKNYQKRLIDYYDYRNAFYHKGEGKFTVEDVRFLEKEACWAIEQYLNNSV